MGKVRPGRLVWVRSVGVGMVLLTIKYSLGL